MSQLKLVVDPTDGHFTFLTDLIIKKCIQKCLKTFLWGRRRHRLVQQNMSKHQLTNAYARTDVKYTCKNADAPCGRLKSKKTWGGGLNQNLGL